MQTLLLLVILFLITIFSILLYFKTKNSRVEKLQAGVCPSCGEKAKEFTDPKTNSKFKYEVIKARLLKNHGCSGVKEIEFSCKSCGLKEVHSVNSTTCSF